MTRWRDTFSACAVLALVSAVPALADEEFAYPPAMPETLQQMFAEPATTASVPAGAEANPVQAGALPYSDPGTSPVINAPSATTITSPFAAIIAERAPLIASSVPRLGENERRDLVAFYAARENRPLWIENGSFTPAAQAVAARLGDASADGLFARDYPVPVLAAASEATMAEMELRLSALAVLYARDARGGRIEPRRLSKLMTPKLALPRAGEVLEALPAAPDANAALAAFNPPHAPYQALRARLADIRKDRTPAEPMVQIPDGPPLRLGMRDARVPLIRARLNLGPSTEHVYDADLVNAVSAFQKSAGLRVTGIVGANTRDAMLSSPVSREDGDLVAQMERWRWLPADLGKRHIIVNVPEYRVRVMQDGAEIYAARVIVGKPETATPIFSHVMDHVVVNPSWFIPPSILKNEILPKLATDPDYAARRGYVVSGSGRNISVRQPPGERNALGHIKFMFPNEHSVYLHDTPGRHLFSADKRAFSHGCVRVDQPMKLGELLLGKDEGWTEARLRSLVGRGERTIRFTNPLPVHITYMTHVVAPDGNLTVYSDIYGFHRQVRAALGLGG